MSFLCLLWQQGVFHYIFEQQD